MAQEFTLRGLSHSGSASIGAKLFIGDSADPDQLIKDADADMYRAKRQRRRAQPMGSTVAQALYS
jgi:GGDEF domain-containing protein